MATNLALDDALLREAQEIGGHKTKKETVTKALLEYIQRRKQKEILNEFGTFEWDDDYNYKKSRRQR